MLRRPLSVFRQDNGMSQTWLEKIGPGSRLSEQWLTMLQLVGIGSQRALESQERRGPWVSQKGVKPCPSSTPSRRHRCFLQGRIWTRDAVSLGQMSCISYLAVFSEIIRPGKYCRHKETVSPKSRLCALRLCNHL